eukprot:m.249775 g.249775  ORF g.249775 m.249775 type:complete len:98 (+) comp22630_c0_seq14:1937-2230(+)
MRLSGLVLALLLLSAVLCVEGQFGNFFGGGFFEEEQFGDAQDDNTAEPDPQEDGYPCAHGGVTAANPADCPCPGFKMHKCKLGDWYVCMTHGTACPE